MTQHTLREYQVEACSDIHAEWESGITRTVIVHSTGLGKTDIIAAICIQEVMAGGRVMVIAHRSELLNQFTERIACYSPIPVGRVQAQRNELDHKIIAGSVQTLCRPERRAKLDEAQWKPTLLVIDEVQHALADSYLDIAEWAGCFDADRLTKLLGVTATLIRGDGLSFDGLFQSVADVRSLDWALSRQLLAKPVTKGIRLDRFWDRFSFRQLTPDELLERNAQRIVAGWVKKAQNRITIAYTGSIKHAQYLLAAFQEANIPAALVIGKTEQEDRKLIYKKLAAGDIRVMVNVGVATEGFDCPQCSCILLARNVQSPGLLVQIIGRGLRMCIDPQTKKPWVDPVTGKAKTNCLVLDTTGVTQQFDITTLIDIDKRRIRQDPTRLQRIAQRAIDSLGGR